MIELGTMVAAILMVSVVGATANAKMATQTFPVLAGAGAHVLVLINANMAVPLQRAACSCRIVTF